MKTETKLIIVLFSLFFILSVGMLIYYFKFIRTNTTTTTVTVINNDSTIEQYSNLLVSLDEIKNQNQTIRVLLEEEKKALKNTNSLILLVRNEILSLKDSLPNTIIEYQIINDTVYPVYKRTITNEFKGWTTGYIKLGKELFDINLRTKDSLIITSGTIRKNIFSSPYYYTKAYNLNPYFNFDTIQSYQTLDWKSRLNYGLIGGAGYGIINNKLDLFVGLGIQYNFK